MKTSAGNICIIKSAEKGECTRKESFRSLSGYPYCWQHFITRQEVRHLWYWFTWHLYRKYIKTN